MILNECSFSQGKLPLGNEARFVPLHQEFSLPFYSLRCKVLGSNIRNSRITNELMNSIILKPQDVVILVKLSGYTFERRPPYALIASDLGMSISEVNAGVRRLQQAQLVLQKYLNELPNRAATEEFLIHGVKYSFPATRTTLVRGMPTSYGAEPLNQLIVPDSDPVPVWPDPKGKVKGLGLIPLYRSVRDACRKDELLYARLALLDAIRSTRARERRIAEAELLKSLRN